MATASPPGDHRIRIDLRHDGNELTARIEDDALAFDALRKGDLVKTLIDEVTYSREHNHNVLFIRKSTATPASPLKRGLG